MTEKKREAPISYRPPYELREQFRARVDTARELLESTRLSVDRVAEQVGLGTGSNLRLHFRRLLDVSPSEYRATFSGRS